jgi:preprotein translocase subunit SecA
MHQGKLLKWQLAKAQTLVEPQCQHYIKTPSLDGGVHIVTVNDYLAAAR